MDRLRLDCPADRDVRRLLASRAHQSGQCPDTVSSDLVPGGPRSCRDTGADFAAVLHVHGQDCLSTVLKHAACALLVVGILAQSGGFFIHMMVGQPNQQSIGNTVTVIDAVLLTCAIAVLVYRLITLR